MISVLHVIILTILILLPVAIVVLIVWAVRRHSRANRPETIQASHEPDTDGAPASCESAHVPQEPGVHAETGKADVWEDED